jgi:hypothetical protein
MAILTTEMPRPQGSGEAPIAQAVTVTMGIVGLTFMFAFGNVLTPALRLGVPRLDRSTRRTGCRPLDPRTFSSTTGPGRATPAHLRPTRQLLIFASAVSRALNVAEPLAAGA